MADQDSEMIALLREIKDLQKAHFERYKEFTAAALEQQKGTAAYVAKSGDAAEQFREEVRE